MCVCFCVGWCFFQLDEGFLGFFIRKKTTPFTSPQQSKSHLFGKKGLKKGE